MTILRLAIASDIHADQWADGESKETYVKVQPPASPQNEHPMADLLRFVADRGLVADFVVCPGDLSNRANDLGKSYGWAQLHELASAMGGARVIATPGNHDLTTRDPVPDPAAALKNLAPTYPTSDAALDAEFWDSGFTIVDGEDFRILVLNSCYDYPPHPGADATPDQIDDYRSILDRGGFPEELQINLESRLATLDAKSVNIALLHHHPVEHERRQVFKDTYGPMRRGLDLIRVLDEHPNAGRWFVIHGHKHVPRIVTAAGDSANAPVVMGAASLGGKLWHPIVTVTRNQFHIVEFHLSHETGLTPMRGTIASYMWGFGAGWSISSRRNCGLPPECGFGPTTDHRALAELVAVHLTANVIEFERWDHLTDTIPALRYQSPRDFDMFEEELMGQGIVLVRDRQERVLQAAREVAAT